MKAALLHKERPGVTKREELGIVRCVSRMHMVRNRNMGPALVGMKLCFRFDISFDDGLISQSKD
jgi:hypothetical protein